MKKFVVAAVVAAMGFVGAASAADMPTKAPILKAPAAPVYNWTGWYVGVNAGYGWGDSDVTFVGGSTAGALANTAFGKPLFDPFAVRNRGALGGLQAGYNWQFAPQWLAGVEADFDFSNINGSATVATGFNTLVLKTAESRLEWFGTLRARFGFLPFDRLLIFGTGGLAYGETKVSGHFDATAGGNFSVSVDGDTFACSTANCIFGSSSKASAGWTAGGGVEYAVWQNVTLRAEYLYVDLGGGRNLRLFNPPNASFIDINFTQRYNIVRAALNYRF